MIYTSKNHRLCLYAKMMHERGVYELFKCLLGLFYLMISPLFNLFQSHLIMDYNPN